MSLLDPFKGQTAGVVKGLLRDLRVGDRLLAEGDYGIHHLTAQRIASRQFADDLTRESAERIQNLIRELLQDDAVLADQGVERAVAERRRWETTALILVRNARGEENEENEENDGR